MLSCFSEAAAVGSLTAARCVVPGAAPRQTGRSLRSLWHPDRAEEEPKKNSGCSCIRAGFNNAADLDNISQDMISRHNIRD